MQDCTKQPSSAHSVRKILSGAYQNFIEEPILTTLPDIVQKVSSAPCICIDLFALGFFSAE